MIIQSWEIALIMVGGSVGMAIVIIGICKLANLGRTPGGAAIIWKLTRCLEKGEEKQTLTKHEQVMEDYRTSKESDGILDGSGKYVQYDTLSSDIKTESETITPSPTTPGDSRTSSPSPSVGESSIASDYDLTHAGLSRAFSCESIVSDFDIMEEEPELPKHGQLEFGLEYDREVGEFIVSVIQARELQTNEYTKTLDTYVWIYLMPDITTKRQTKIQKDTTNPVYKERFLYNVDPEDIDQRTVQFQMYSVDKFARPKLIGETELKIGDVDITSPVRVWMNLRDINEEPHESVGDVMFSLSYLPTAERLTVVIVKARNLTFTNTDRPGGDPYVRVYFIQNGKKIKIKKTSVKRSDKNPIFNEAMIFKVPSIALPEAEFRISVGEKLSEGKSSPIGHVIVGSHTTGTELAHWNQMITSLRKPVSAWHNLRKPKQK